MLLGVDRAGVAGGDALRLGIAVVAVVGDVHGVLDGDGVVPAPVLDLLGGRRGSGDGFQDAAGGGIGFPLSVGGAADGQCQ